jgi:hypothetical protein
MRWQTVKGDDEARIMTLWTGSGLITEGIGPQAEWDPVIPALAQSRHASYWATVSGMIPDDENDEAYWMTQEATRDLLHNDN